MTIGIVGPTIENKIANDQDKLDEFLLLLVPYPLKQDIIITKEDIIMILGWINNLQVAILQKKD